MNDEMIQEIRESLRKIEALATPVVIAPAHASEVELDQIRKALSNDGGSRFIDLKTVEPVFDSSAIVGCLPTKRNVSDVVNAINTLAVTNSDVIHIFVNYLANINSLAVFAYAQEHDYANEDNNERLFERNVWLSHDFALNRLLSIESQLTELIIKAREAAEGES